MVVTAIAGDGAELTEFEIGAVMFCCDEDGGGAEDEGEGSIGLGDCRDLGDKDDEASAIRAVKRCILLRRGFVNFLS